jgi:Uma2 family endonuclease
MIMHAPQRLMLYDVDWQTYTRLLRIFAERPAVRLTYDRGVLEIMSPLLEHDGTARFLLRLIVALAEELGLPIRAGGSTTCRRRRLKRGLEPDECFWIANEPQIRSKRRLDLRVDPPPDLAIEVEATRSSLNRLSIYAKLKVPEVWRFDGQDLTFHVLQANGQYDEADHSLAFPKVTPADLLRFLALFGQIDDNSIVQQFRSWVRSWAAGTPSP